VPSFQHRFLTNMTNRVSYEPQDFQRKSLQAERDHESRKLVVLLERVKRQIADQENPDSKVDSPKPPATALTMESGSLRLSSQPAAFER
jgi:hypothetical protein